MTPGEARYPYQAPIDAYGNGGFRFADMSHRGSILCLPSGIHAWEAKSGDALTPESFQRVLDQPIKFLLLGTGARQVFPSKAVKEAFAAAGIGLEPMDTGAAARTYNVLLAEKRPVGAALIAVD
jgi:uncharacterized protein